MYSMTTRPLSTEEHTQFEEWLTSVWKNPFNPVADDLWWSLVPLRLPGLGWRVEEMRKQRQQERETQQHMRRPIARKILDENCVEIHSLQPSAAAMLQQTEDEGESYFFQIGPQLIYCLPYQQHLPENVERANWPNTDFGIVHTRGYPLLLDIQCQGSPMPWIRVLPGSFDLWGLLNRGKIFLGSGCFAGTVATLEEDLARHAEEIEKKDH